MIGPRPAPAYFPYPHRNCAGEKITAEWLERFGLHSGADAEHAAPRDDHQFAPVSDQSHGGRSK